MSGRGVAGLVVAVAALVVLPSAAADDARSSKLPRVTLIGDSISEPLLAFKGAQAVLSEGVDLDLEIEVCRRLDHDSCPNGSGVRAPTLVDVVHSMGPNLGRTVIVEVGYNDFADQYAANIESALRALREAGVERVVWTTLRAPRDPYPAMNDAIRAAAAVHPEVTLADWDAYSRGHPDWFQPDGLHLTGVGVQPFAVFLHRALVDLAVPLVVTSVAPASGAESGGTTVTIRGTGFRDVESVRFGGAPAQTVAVDSPTTIVATTPPGTGSVAVSVVTAEGSSAPSADARFTYTPECVVPRVVGRRLAVARKLLAGARCAVGAVTRTTARRARVGFVVAQRPAARTHAPVGTRVALVVGARAARRTLPR